MIRSIYKYLAAVQVLFMLGVSHAASQTGDTATDNPALTHGEDMYYGQQVNHPAVVKLGVYPPRYDTNDPNFDPPQCTATVFNVKPETNEVFFVTAMHCFHDAGSRLRITQNGTVVFDGQKAGPADTVGAGQYYPIQIYDEDMEEYDVAVVRTKFKTLPAIFNRNVSYYPAYNDLHVDYPDVWQMPYYTPDNMSDRTDPIPPASFGHGSKDPVINVLGYGLRSAVATPYYPNPPSYSPQESWLGAFRLMGNFVYLTPPDFPHKAGRRISYKYLGYDNPQYDLALNATQGGDSGSPVFSSVETPLRPFAVHTNGSVLERKQGEGIYIDKDLGEGLSLYSDTIWLRTSGSLTLANGSNNSHHLVGMADKGNLNLRLKVCLTDVRPDPVHNNCSTSTSGRSVTLLCQNVMPDAGGQWNCTASIPSNLSGNRYLVAEYDSSSIPASAKRPGYVHVDVRPPVDVFEALNPATSKNTAGMALVGTPYRLYNDEGGFVGRGAAGGTVRFTIENPNRPTDRKTNRDICSNGNSAGELSVNGDGYWYCDIKVSYARTFASRTDSYYVLLTSRTGNIYTSKRIALRVLDAQSNHFPVRVDDKTTAFNSRAYRIEADQVPLEDGDQVIVYNMDRSIAYLYPVQSKRLVTTKDDFSRFWPNGIDSMLCEPVQTEHRGANKCVPIAANAILENEDGILTYPIINGVPRFTRIEEDGNAYTNGFSGDFKTVTALTAGPPMFERMWQNVNEGPNNIGIITSLGGPPSNPDGDSGPNAISRYRMARGTNYSDDQGMRHACDQQWIDDSFKDFAKPFTPSAQPSNNLRTYKNEFDESAQNLGIDHTGVYCAYGINAYRRADGRYLYDSLYSRSYMFVYLNLSVLVQAQASGSGANITEAAAAPSGSKGKTRTVKGKVEGPLLTDGPTVVVSYTKKGSTSPARMALDSSLAGGSKGVELCRATVDRNNEWKCSTVTFPSEGDYDVVAMLKNSDGSDRVKANTTTHIDKDKCDDDKNNNDPECDEDEDDNQDENDPEQPSQNSPDQGGSVAAPASAAAAAASGVAGAAGGLAGAFGSAILGAAGGSALGGYLKMGLAGGGTRDIPFTVVDKKHWRVDLPSDLACGQKIDGELMQTLSGKDFGKPLKTTFTTGICITTPVWNAEFVTGTTTGFPVAGKATPDGKKLYRLLVSGLALPASFKDTPKALICDTTIDANGNWACPNSITPSTEGAFNLFAAQYLNENGTWKQAGEDYLTYRVRTTPVHITTPVAGSTQGLKFTIAGTGQNNTRIIIPAIGDNPACDTPVDDKGNWVCPLAHVLTPGKYTLTAMQYPAQSGMAPTSRADVSFQVRDAAAPSVLEPVTIALPSSEIAAVDALSGVYPRYAFIPLRGRASSGTSICIDTVPLDKPCYAGMMVPVNAAGNWETPYPLTTQYTGTFPLVATAFDADGRVESTFRLSYAVSAAGEAPVAITSLLNASVYRQSDNLVLHGTGQPGTQICIGAQVQKTVCSDGSVVDSQGRWASAKPLPKATGIYNRVVATAFAQGAIQSSTGVNYKIVASGGEDIVISSPADQSSAYQPGRTYPVTGTAKPGSQVCLGEALITKRCADPLNVAANGTWTGSPLYADPLGSHRLVASLFTGEKRTSFAVTGYSVKDKDDSDALVALQYPTSGTALAPGSVAYPRGAGESYMSVCVSDKAFDPDAPQPRSGCVSVTGGKWTSKVAIPTDKSGPHTVYVAQFDDGELHSVDTVSYWVFDQLVGQ